MNNQNQNVSRGASLSAWLVYVIIVFEIIFMVSPAALYYYSAYAPPLNLLASSPYTSWLVQYILPHFTYHSSATAAFLVAASWPIIVLGLLIFIWSFCQIYFAKFTHGGPVTTGLYRYIRHPQYTGLAIVGLGTAFFWSRFLVVITYITMLFLYVLLARDEENRCKQAFGENYEDYLSKTSRFLPGRRMQNVPGLHFFQLCIVYVVSLLLSVGAGFALKQHVIDEMLVITEAEVSVIVVAPMDQSKAKRVIDLANPAMSNVKPSLAYLAPSSWSIPELGLLPEYNLSASDELSHPMLHGNPPDYNGSRFKLLVTEPIFRTEASQGLLNIISTRPLYAINIDLETGTAERTDKLNPGKWQGIPVPVY